MKSVVIERRRARRIAAGLCCVSVILGFVACSGSSERRTSRNDGGAGKYDGSDAGAPNSSGNGGGSSSQGGEPAAGATGVAGGEGATAGAAGDVGVAGSGQGGETSNGGQSFGGESSGGESSGGVAGQSAGGEGGGVAGGGGEAGAGGVLDPVCGLNLAQVGSYSQWCGKVNMHLTAQGTWTHDADCSSGCRTTAPLRLQYCQKFYPTTTAIVPVDQVASGIKDWKNAGCADSLPDAAGIDGEYACCAPLP